MKSRTYPILFAAVMLLLGSQAAWSFTEDQKISVNMGWFTLEKLDMSKFNLQERQLGGVRLGDTIYNYLGHRDGHVSWTAVAKYYGNPTGLVVGGSAAQAAMAAPTAPYPAGASAGTGYPGVAPYPAGGAGMVAPGAALLGGTGSSLEAARRMAGSAVAAGGVQIPPLVPFPSAAALAFQIAPGMSLPPPAAVTAPSPVTATSRPGAESLGLSANLEEPNPNWARPVWFDLRPGEVEYIYHKTPDLVIGIVVDEEGIITAVAVAGAPTNFAKTSLGRAHRYVKLGDLFKMALYRYGYPDSIHTFNVSGDSFVSTTGQFDNDCILWYDEETDNGVRKNIAFTCHNMKVTRIHIWIPQEAG